MTEKHPFHDAPPDEASALLAAMAEDTTDLFWVVDAEHFGLLAFNRGLHDYVVGRHGSAPVLGQTPEALLPGAEARDWRTCYERALQDAAHATELAVGERTLELRLAVMRRAGQAFAISGFGRDISERKAQAHAERMQMVETVRLSEEKYRRLFDNAEVGMYRTRADGSAVLDFNEKYLQIYGLKREEMLGRPTAAYWADLGERVKLLEMLKVKGRVADFECRMRTKNGDIRTCLASAYLDADEGIVEGTIIDITDRKQAEEDRLRLEQELAQSQRLESLGVVAGGIAHDFNNLMAAIYGHVELALKRTIDTEAALNLSHALSSMAQARDLTRQLLTFAKGGSPVRTIGKLFPLVEESARFALSGSRATCACDVPPDLWSCLFDHNQVGQVIGNLVINALQAGADVITIEARNATLLDRQVATLPAGKYVRVSVTDNGNGIAPAVLPKVFDPFYTTKKNGRGLGLSTCHSILRRHEGAITVESKPGGGATFHLYLPAAIAGIPRQKEKEPTAQHLGKGTVLVMDDDHAVREILAGMLAALGYASLTASDGSAALELFSKERKSGRSFRAVLLDLTVAGGMGGKEAAQGLRALDGEVPIFVTSGYAEDPVMEDPLAHGFQASLRKPFTLSDLSQLLERHLTSG